MTHFCSPSCCRGRRDSGDARRRCSTAKPSSDASPRGTPNWSSSTDEGSQEIPRCSCSIAIRPRRAAAPLPVISVEFIDGTRICATRVRPRRLARATIETPYAEKPLKYRRSGFASPSCSRRAMQRALVEATCRTQLAGDALVVVKREGGKSTISPASLGDVTADQVAFDWDGQTCRSSEQRSPRIVYYHAKQRAVPEARCRLTLMDGSRIPVARHGAGRRWHAPRKDARRRRADRAARARAFAAISPRASSPI